jgi:HSP90 family molecular chaperone
MDFQNLKLFFSTKAIWKVSSLTYKCDKIFSKTDCVPIISIYSKVVDGNKQLIISDNGIGFDMDKVKR